MLFSQIKPMLLTMGKESEIIDGDNWIFDIKWDGWRIVLHKEGDKTEAYTRFGNNVTSKFPELSEVNRAIQAQTAIIDCEGVVLRNGYSVFDDFAHRGRLGNKERIEQAAVTHPVTFVAFDLLYIDGRLLINEPLAKRKELLSSIITASNVIDITPSIVGEGSHMFQFTKERNMEGIVGKRSDSIYQINKRSTNWKKFKHFKVGTAVILAYKESPFTLIVGIFSNGRTKVCGSIEFGFKTEEKAAFRQIAKDIIIKKERNSYWLEPRLCCNVQYLEKTEKGLLRITSFKGFNFDKNPEDCLII